MKNRPVFIIVIVILLSGCKAEKSEIPAPDLNAIRTQAVQTAVWEMTVQAVLHPVATQIPSTAALLPAATMEPAIPVPSSGGSDGSSGSTGGAEGSSDSPVPTRTPDVYSCEYLSQNPLDKPQMTGADYDMVWTIKNTGIATWRTNEYYIKWLGGSDLSPRHTYPLAKNVTPYETVNIVVDIQIPTNPTDQLQVTRWGIVNDNGDVFCKFFHAIPSTYPAPIKTPTSQP